MRSIHWIATFVDDAGREFAWLPVQPDHSEDAGRQHEEAIDEAMRLYPDEYRRAARVDVYPVSSIDDERQRTLTVDEHTQARLAEAEYDRQRAELDARERRDEQEMAAWRTALALREEQARIDDRREEERLARERDAKESEVAPESAEAQV